MISTASALASLQFDRIGAFPAKFADNPLRAVMLDAVQRRNATLDSLFYNVSNIDPVEYRELAFWLAREGALLIVPPEGAGRLGLYLDKASFLAAGGGKVAALAVAGVGSSAVGSAAFARDIANALKGPVAAVVSGYGLSDVLTEALGGFFWFGALNSLRHGFEELDRQTKRFSASEQVAEASEFLRLSKDTITLISLLEDEAFETPLLVGHSKGNLVLSEALYALAQTDSIARVAAQSKIITFSAKVGMPDAFSGRVFDVIGQWDSFGALNSRSDISADLIVPGAWHSTNPDFPLGMGIRVTEVMSQVQALMQSPLTRPEMGKGVLAHILDLPQWFVGSMAAARYPWGAGAIT